jgi:nitroreductase
VVSYSQPVTEIIRKRFSCRTYTGQPIDEPLRAKLEAFLSGSPVGPLATRARFALLAATDTDRDALRGLGTYGMIKGATGYIAGAVARGDRDMEDLGYLMERIVLYATDVGLGTCWLGGTFTRSRFAEQIALQRDETLPAVLSVGPIAGRPRLADRAARRLVRADKRLPWERLFFDGRFGRPLSRERAGAAAVPLDMVRLGPSASNKQPWRVMMEGDAWHLYLQRTPGYNRGTGPDLQRVDAGIAMAHLELAAAECGLHGTWQTDAPPIDTPDERTQYIASWVTQKS